MAGAHVQIYLWTFDRGWPQKYIIQKWMSGIYDVNVEGNSLVMCSCNGSITAPADLHFDWRVRQISSVTLAKPALVYTSIHSTVTARYFSHLLRPRWPRHTMLRVHLLKIQPIRSIHLMDFCLLLFFLIMDESAFYFISYSKTNSKILRNTFFDESSRLFVALHVALLHHHPMLCCHRSAARATVLDNKSP